MRIAAFYVENPSEVEYWLGTEQQSQVLFGPAAFRQHRLSVAARCALLRSSAPEH